MTDADPLPPWIAPSTVDGRLPADLAAPAVAHDAIYRVATHAGTITEAWYDDVSAQLGDLAYVEIVGIASTVAAVVAFRRAAGLPPLTLAAAIDGEPSHIEPPELVAAALNWVRVTPPADEVAAVVQAYSSVPAEHQRLWMLAAAQYIPNEEMVDPLWTRGTLSRAQIELVPHGCRSSASASIERLPTPACSVGAATRVRPRSTSATSPPARAMSAFRSAESSCGSPSLQQTFAAPARADDARAALVAAGDHAAHDRRRRRRGELPDDDPTRRWHRCPLPRRRGSKGWRRRSS